MRTSFDILERFRVNRGQFTSDRGDRFGLFLFTRNRVTLQVIACAALPETNVPWEHVSVVAKYRNKKGKTIERIPTWDEMCFIKEAFWETDEAVMQLHVPAAEHINNHAHCLHLWKPTEQAIPLPPSITVGIKTAA